MSGGITEAFARSPSAEIKCAFGACVSDSHERWIRIIRIRKHIVIFATTVIDLRTFGLEKLLGGCTNEYKKKCVAIGKCESLKELYQRIFNNIMLIIQER